MPKGSAFNWEDPSDPTAATSVAANPGAPVTGNWNAAMQLKSSKQQSSWLSWRLRCKTDGSVYDLYAVCNHYGDMQGGHYTGGMMVVMMTMTVLIMVMMMTLMMTMTILIIAMMVVMMTTTILIIAMMTMTTLITMMMTIYTYNI